MAQSVSNDALWVKLSEIEEKINRCLEEQKTVTSTHKQVDISPALKANKDEIIAEIKERYKLLGMHGDSNYAAINQNIKTVRDILKKVGNVVIRIRKQQKESIEQVSPQKKSVEPQKENETAYFNFRFFKIRKASLAIAVLGLLVFSLTLFSMKQQNDYSLLLNRYYRQSITIEQLKTEMDSINNANQERMNKKR